MDTQSSDSAPSDFAHIRAAWRVPDEVDDVRLRLLLAVSLVSFFEEYDIAMLTSALGYIALGLHIREAALPDYLGVIRLGALPAFFLVPYADRVGRRRIFLISLVGMGVATLLTAFSRTAPEFVVLQMLTRIFFVSGSAVAVVFIAEEFPAEHRGYGIGLLGALAVSGHGFSAMLFAFIDHLPFGWRALYVVGIVPVLLYPRLSKRIPETHRFEAHRLAQTSSVKEGIFAWLDPLRDMASARPLRALGIALGGLLPSFGIIATFQFTGYFALKVHGWLPRDYAIMVVAAGAVGIFGNVLAGRFADVFGRRAVGAVLLISFPAFATLFYRGPGWCLPIAWAACVFTSQGGRAILRALATELFPTAYRGTASGLFAILDVVGSAAGLFMLGGFVARHGNLATSVPWIAAVTAGGGAVVLFLPETRARELEATSG